MDTSRHQALRELLTKKWPTGIYFQTPNFLIEIITNSKKYQDNFSFNYSYEKTDEYRVIKEHIVVAIVAPIIELDGAIF